MTALSPAPFQKFFDNNGAPLAKGLLFTYLAGTTTKTTTWQDSAGSVTNTNPIVLDYRGECNLWITPNVAYKYVLSPATDTDPPTNPIKTIDNVVNSQLITLYGGVDTGVANAYVLNFTANFTAYQDGIVIYWVPSHTNTTTSTVNVNGLGIVNILNVDGTALSTGNNIINNQITGMIYKGGSFYLLAPSPINGSFTGTLTGMTVATTGTVKYHIINNICTLYVDLNFFGTSNTTAMTMTGLPSAVIPQGAFNARTVPCILYDNTIEVAGFATVNNTGSQIVFALANVSGVKIISNSAGFTAAGSKGLLAQDFSISYPL